MIQYWNGSPPGCPLSPRVVREKGSEGIVGSQFTLQVIGTTVVAGYQAIIPQIEGKAFITGLHQFVVDPTDPLADGFLLG